MPQVINDLIMKEMVRIVLWLMAFVLAFELCSCERLDNDVNKHITDKNPAYLELHELVEIMALLPIAREQMDEVHAAVSSSSVNGYDEEYTMANLFALPGSGVGDQAPRSGTVYNFPMRDLISDAVRDLAAKESKTRAQRGDLHVLKTLDRIGADAFLESLSRSDMQIYWPFSENWDGEQMPIITYDPEDGSTSNIGYRLVLGDDGFRHVEEVEVDE